MLDVDKFKDDKSRQKDAVDVILATILGLIVFVMFCQVVFRYVFNNSLTWSEEVVRFLFIWLNFLGSSILIRDKLHIGVDYFVDILPPYLTKWVRLFDVICIVCFLVFITISGLCWMYFTRNTVSSALGLPLNIILYGALPISSIFGIIFGIRRIKNEFIEIRKGSKRL